MKKHLMVTIVCALLSVSAYAQTKTGFEVGASVMDYGYTERFEGDIVASDDGNFLGFSGGYTRAFQNRAFVRGTLSLDFGAADYNSDNGETRLNDVAQMIGRLEIHGGRDFAVNDRVTLSPFAGIGSRVLLDSSGGEVSSNGMEGYDREIAYRYIPIGAAATFGLQGNKSLSISGQYNWIIGGRAESHLKDIDPELPNLTLDLDGGSGYELAANFNVGRLSVGPFLRSWSIHQSKSIVIDDPEGSGDMFEFFEPANRTREAGVRFTYHF